MTKMIEWQQLEDIDPSYSGYAWISFQNQYAEGMPWFPAGMCRVWTHHTSKTSWWTGWDLESDEPLKFRSPCKIILVDQPNESLDSPQK